MKSWLRPKLTLGRKLLLIVCVPVTLQIATTVIVTWFVNYLTIVAQHQMDAKEVLGRANWLSFEIAGSALFWTAKTLTGDPVYSNQFVLESEKRQATLNEFEQVLVTEPGQSENIKELTRELADFSDSLKRTDARNDLAPAQRVQAFFSSNDFKNLWMGPGYSRTRRNILAADRHVYSVLPVYKVLPVVLPVLTQWLNRFAWVVCGLTLLVGIVIIYIAAGIVRRLGVVTENAWLLASDKPLQKPVGGDDEVALLDETFHFMAAALKETAEKEQAVINHASDVICSIDPEDRLAVVNPASSTVLGYDADQLVGRRVASIIVDDDIEPTIAFLKQARVGKHQSTFESRMKKKDGKVIDILWSVSFSLTDKSLFCVLHDITARKQAERMRQELINMISHDIRTPLTTMQISLDALDKTKDESQREASVDRVRRVCDVILTLTKDYLDMQKLETGMLEIDRSIIKLSDVFEQCIVSTSGLAEQKAVNVEVRPCDLTCYGDPDRLLQVLINLISNAVKFSPKHGTVILSAIAQENLVRVIVEDEGRSVPEHLQKTIFDRFRQVEAKDGTAMKGTGLGLAICKALVELHGGEIWCENRDGKRGSRFCFTVPSQASSDFTAGRD